MAPTSYHYPYRCHYDMIRITLCYIAPIIGSLACNHISGATHYYVVLSRRARWRGICPISTFPSEAGAEEQSGYVARTHCDWRTPGDLEAIPNDQLRNETSEVLH